MHPAPFFYKHNPDQKSGTMGNFTHWEGDDPQAWSLPYFPHTDTTQGMDSDCVQVAVEPCPHSSTEPTAGPSSQSM